MIRTCSGSAGADGRVEELTGAGTTTRAAAAMTGIARSSVDRDRRRPSPSHLPRPAPANAFAPRERERLLRLLDDLRFVDAAPAQIYAALLDQGVYVGSIATVYRILREHRQVKERRRLARHPARQRPELVADAPRAGVPLGQRLRRWWCGSSQDLAGGRPVRCGGLGRH